MVGCAYRNRNKCNNGNMKQYLSVSDIAQITNKERSTVFRWIKAGKFGRVRRIGQEYQVSHESFAHWWSRHVSANGERKPEQ